MPLTSAEKMKRYREKLKNIGMYENLKAKNRVQARNSRMKCKKNIENLPTSKMNKKLEEIRRKTRERVAKYRAKKSNVVTDLSTGYTSAKTLGKAKSRVKKALPSCPIKRGAVLRKILEEIDLDGASTSSETKHRKSLSADVISKVKFFYERDDISRQAPGLKDTKTVREQGMKSKKQVRHLFTTLKETYALFVEEYAKLLGKSKFAEMRPQHVLLNSAIPRTVCLCKYHENFILAVKALHGIIQILPAYDSHFLYSHVLCQTPTRSCWYNECKRCKNKLKKKIQHAIRNVDIPAEVTWYFWTEDLAGKICKSVENGTFEALLEHIISMLPSFKMHSFIKKNQARAYEMDKMGVCKNIEASLLQIDFSENYKCLAQDEIQSFHWVQPQVSLFTVSLWHSGRHFPMVIVSDNLHHNKETVVPYVDRVLQEIPESVKNIHIWSDGPVTQFKNRFIAAAIRVLEKRSKNHIVWNFFATSHGKGPVDGIGGALKRVIRGKVMGREEIVFNAHQFCEVGNKYSNVKVIEMTQEEINTKFIALQLGEVFKKAPMIVNIAKTHQMYYKNNEIVLNNISTESIKSYFNTVYGSESDCTDDEDTPLSIMAQNLHK